MAFPAAPTESGGDKFVFLTTDGNAAAGQFAVDTGSTTTGSNTVGFVGIATHVEGDAVGSPGGLSTTSVPLVLVGADDASGNAIPLQANAGGDLKITLDSETVVLGAAATTAIGKLGANSGVDIGDVDVTSLIPGTAATSLGKAEDAAHSSGDTGVMGLAVRRDANTTLVGTDGDYAPVQVDANGALKVEIFDGGDSHTVDNAGTFAVQSTLQAGTAEIGKLAAGTAEIGKLAAGTAEIGNVKNAGTFAVQSTLQAGTAEFGKLAAGSATIGEVTVGAATTATGDLAKAEDVAHGTGDVGIQMLAVRKATPADLSGTDGDYEPLQLDNGRLWTSSEVVGEVASDAADSGNPVKIGGRAAAAELSTPVDEGDRVDAWFDRYGRLVTQAMHPDPEPPDTSTITSASATSMIAAPGANLHLHVTGIQASNGHTAITRLDITDGSGGTVLKSMYLAADGGGYTAAFNPPFRCSANTALFAISSVNPTTNDIRVNIDYFISKDVDV